MTRWAVYLLELVLKLCSVLVCTASQIILTSRHKPPGSSPRHHSHLLLPGSVYPLPKALVSLFLQSVTCLRVCILHNGMPGKRKSQVATYSFFSTSCCGPSILQNLSETVLQHPQTFSSVDLWHLNFPGGPLYACVETCG